MKKALLLLAVLVAVGLAFVPQRSPFRLAWRKLRGEPVRQRAQPLKAQLDEDAMSPDFLQEAWIVFLPVRRQQPDDQGNMVGVGQADAAVSGLQHLAKTRADWLVYSEISDYSLAKLLRMNTQRQGNTQVLVTPEECVSAVMAAMRNKRLHARQSECKRVEANTGEAH